MDDFSMQERDDFVISSRIQEWPFIILHVGHCTTNDKSDA